MPYFRVSVQTVSTKEYNVEAANPSMAELKARTAAIENKTTTEIYKITDTNGVSADILRLHDSGRDFTEQRPDALKDL